MLYFFHFKNVSNAIFVETRFSILSAYFSCCQIGLPSHIHLHQLLLFWLNFGFWICCLWIGNLEVHDQNIFCNFCNILHTFHHHGFLSQCLEISLRVDYKEEYIILEEKLKLKKVPLLSINCDNDHLGFGSCEAFIIKVI